MPGPYTEPVCHECSERKQDVHERYRDNAYQGDYCERHWWFLECADLLSQLVEEFSGDDGLELAGRIGLDCLLVEARVLMREKPQIH